MFDELNEIEEKTLNQVMFLEDQFREHNTLVLKEMQTQKELIDRLWILSQRYMILVSTGPCCKYPEIYSAPAEDVVLQEYHEKIKHIRASNCRIVKSLNELRTSSRCLENLCSKLDSTSILTLGDAFHKPIAFFKELIYDLFNYFHAHLLMLKYHVAQFDPADSTPLEDFKLLLEPCEDFQEYLLLGLTYCRCLRPKATC